MKYELNIELSLVDVKLICCLLITLSAAFGVMIPFWSNAELAETTDKYAFVVCLTAGVLLSGSLVHLLPDAIEDIGAYASTVLAGGCVMLLLAIGEMATHLLPDRGLGHFPSVRESNMELFFRRTASFSFGGLGKAFLESPQLSEPDGKNYFHLGNEEVAVCSNHDSPSTKTTAPSSQVDPDSGNKNMRASNSTVSTEAGSLQTQQDLRRINDERRKELLKRNTKLSPEMEVAGRQTAGPKLSYLHPTGVASNRSGIVNKRSFVLDRSHSVALPENKPEGLAAEVRSYCLFLALSFHSVMEGLGIGSARTEDVVGPIFIAIMAHKSLTGFALGSTLMRANIASRAFLIMVLLFALCTPIGVIFGMCVASKGSTWSAVGIALASGTFLQVSMLEITARQMADEQFKLAKVSGLCVGFGIMSWLGLYV